MKLYRPVGFKELELIKESEWTQFPPRLPEQPIFYPVLNIEYARQIAKDWNSKSAPHFAGYVTEFEIDDQYIKVFKVRIVGSSMHKEIWVSAEELANFNRHIIGKIHVAETYLGKGSDTVKKNTEALEIRL